MEAVVKRKEEAEGFVFYEIIANANTTDDAYPFRSQPLMFLRHSLLALFYAELQNPCWSVPG